MNTLSFKMRYVVILALIVIIAAAGFFWINYSGKTKIVQKTGEQNTTQKVLDNSKDQGQKMFSLNLIKPAFAEYERAGETTKPMIPYEKVEFSELANAKNISDTEKTTFSPEQIKALEESGFYLAYNNVIGSQDDWGNKDDFYDTYNHFIGSTNMYYREPQNAVYISSDYALHMYHILVDRSFQRLEETKLQPLMRSVTKTLFEDSIKNYYSATNPEIKESYKRLSVYYLIPLVVLDSPDNQQDKQLKPEDFSNYSQFIEAQDKASQEKAKGKLNFALTDKAYDKQILSDDIYQLAKKELELIEEAKSIVDSPFFTPLRPEFKNDYSQFVPRSHYTKNDVLKSYFIAMMWYGRMGFALTSPELTRDAIIITGQVNTLDVDGQKLSKLWSDLSSIIEFFVGNVDDLTPYEYTQEIKKIYGDNITDEELANNDFLNNFILQAKKDLRGPKILSEAIMMNSVDEKTKEELLNDTKQFRFMGQRFTLDAYALNKLTQGDEAPDPETGQKLPSTPTALMPISLLNSDNKVVKNYLDSWIAENAPNSDKVISKYYGQLQKEISGYDKTTWSQNIYWSWLDCMRTLLTPYGQGYPYFMIGDAWQKKNLATALGSYTELKHDTLLYAKQSYAELGGGGGENPNLPPTVKGYVEPDLEFWNKIISLAEKTQKGLKERNALPEEFENKYATFITSNKFFRDVAKQELQNSKISDDDFEKLRVINVNLGNIFEPLPGQELTAKEKRAGIIADIHTDVVKNKILYEATGRPYIIYVAIKDINGTRLTRGAVFNHYEFANEIKGRLTDEDWQEKVYVANSGLPTADVWSSELVK